MQYCSRVTVSLTSSAQDVPLEKCLHFVKRYAPGMEILARYLIV